MSFDIARLDTRTLSEQGVPMKIINPKTRVPVTRDDGSVATITLLGRASDQYRETQRLISERRAEQAARGIRPNPDEIEGDDVEVLVACTRAWTIDEMDGQPFPFTPENARRLWSDKRFPWLRDQAIMHMRDDGNFLAS